MQQDNNIGNIKDKAIKRSEDKIEKEQDWRNEHGRPSLEFLQSLANDGSPRSLEKLKAIAQDLDVSYSSGNTSEELIDKILYQVRTNPTTTN